MWKLIAAILLCLEGAWAQNPPAPVTVVAKGTEPAPPPATATAPAPAKAPVPALELQRLSVERQMQAIRDNYPAPFAWSTGSLTMAAALPPVPPAADCPPVTAAQMKPIIEREAAKQKLDVRLVQAMVEAESAYSPCAVSPVGAMGLMQLMPATAESLQVADPYDPSQNITAGTQYLKQMLERYGGDIAKALAAYNAGPARVDAAGGIPSIPETQEYVRKIMGKISPVSPVR